MRLLLLPVSLLLLKTTVRAWMSSSSSSFHARGGGDHPGGGAGESKTSTSSSAAVVLEDTDQQTAEKTRMSNLARQLPPLEAGHARIVLLRHGETDWNRQGLIQGGGYDLELNQAGREQAYLARGELQGFPLGVIVSSHLERSSQTADIIAKNFPGAVRIIQPKFGEMRFGSFEGFQVRVPPGKSPLQEDQQQHKELLEYYHSINQMIQQHEHVEWPGGGESRAAVVQRGTKGLQQVLGSYPTETHFCIVAHGRFNRLLLSSLFSSQSDDKMIEFQNMNQGNTCINVLDVHRETNEWKAHILNYVDHIDSAAARQAPS